LEGKKVPREASNGTFYHQSNQIMFQFTIDAKNIVCNQEFLEKLGSTMAPDLAIVPVRISS